jgi:hypothetical protein
MTEGKEGWHLEVRNTECKKKIDGSAGCKSRLAIWFFLNKHVANQKPLSYLVFF